MRICYIADAMSIHTQRWVKYFADRGYEIHLISPMPLRDGDIGKAELHVLKRFPLQVRIVSFPVNLLLYVIQIKQSIRKIKPHILHAHFIADCGFWGALSGFHPFVLSAWGSDILVWPNKSRIYRYFVKFALKRADLVTCDAGHMIEKLVELGALREKIELIYFGTDARKFKPEQKSQQLAEKLGVANSPIVISLRHLTPIYDVESLVRSIPLVLKEAPKAKFIIAGKGEQRKYLENLAKTLAISRSTKFVGLINNDELPQYLNLADIYVSTSLSDAGLSASTAEAMACSLPVVTTDFGDNRKWIEDGVNGFVVPLRDHEALALKITYLLQNRDKRQEFGQANRQVIEEKNNWNREMGRMDKLYNKLVERYHK